MKNILKHCASMKNPPKGYGSIEAGMKVTALRSKVVGDALARGLAYEEAATLAEKEIVKTFGSAF